MNPRKRQLVEFVPHYREEKLKKKISLIAWYLFFNPLIASKFNISFFRIIILRFFGATIGKKVKFRSGVKVHIPNNLEIGNFSWIGENSWFINHAKVSIGSNVCISQRSIICSGSHNYKTITLEFAHKPITINDGAWICLDSKVLPGVTIGECSVVSAGEIVRKSLPDYSMLIDGRVRKINPPR